MNRFLSSLRILVLSGALTASGFTTPGNKNRVVLSSMRSGLASQTSANPCLGRIAFVTTRDSGNYEVYVMNSDGTEQTRLTNHTATDLGGSWSPDGSMIAFQSDRDNLLSGRYDIYVMNADGSNVSRLTTNAAFDEEPSWSPDGTKIAFVSTRDDPNNNIRELYVMNADGSNQTRLTFGNSAQGPAWSPDGSKIAFTSYSGVDPGSDVFIISGDAGAVSRLTYTPGLDDGGAVWSPDGRQLAFTLIVPGPDAHYDIYLMDADGTNRRNLTNTPDLNETAASWSPDGSVIAFSKWASFESPNVYLMYPDGSGQSKLTDGPGINGGSAWQPNQTAPCLLTEPDTEHAVALDSVTFVHDLFKVTTPHNFSQDNRTRIALFARNLRLLPNDDASAVTAQAEDVQHGVVVPLPVDFVETSPCFPWLTQVNVMLPDVLKSGGDYRISISLHGSRSNKALVSIAPDSAPP